jgi:hypothetical protein
MLHGMQTGMVTKELVASTSISKLYHIGVEMPPTEATRLWGHGGRSQVNMRSGSRL